MPHTIKTEALVLRKRSLLEKDIVLTFFTKENGKIRAIAKGVKKITSRRSAHTQTGNLTSIELYAKHETYYLQSTSIISAFSQIKNNSDKVNMLYRFLFIIDRILPEGVPEYGVYNVTVKFLIYLSNAETPSHEQFAKYLSQILDYLGYGAQSASLSDLIRKVEEIIHEKVPDRVII